MAKTLIPFLSGMPLGMGLFAATAIISVLGTLAPALFPAYQRSVPFIAALVLLTLNTGLCAVRQARTLGRLLRMGRTGLREGIYRVSLWLVHASVVAVALGGLGSALLSRSAAVELAVGESARIPAAYSGGRDIQVRLADFRTDFHADGSVAEWRSVLELRVDDGPAQERVLRVNHPVSLGSVSLLQSSHRKVGGADLSGIALRYDPALPAVWIGFALMALAACGLLAGGPSARRPASRKEHRP